MGEHTAEDRGVEGSIPSRPIIGILTPEQVGRHGLTSFAFALGFDSLSPHFIYDKMFIKDKWLGVL